VFVIRHGSSPPVSPLFTVHLLLFLLCSDHSIHSPPSSGLVTLVSHTSWKTQLVLGLSHTSLGLCHYVWATWSRCQGYKTHLEIRCYLTCGRVEIPTFFRVLRDMDIPWWYLWVGRCNDHEVLHKLSPLFSNGCSESGTVWGLSGKVTEHVVTYIRAWSVTRTFPLYLLGGNCVPGPSVCRGFLWVFSPYCWGY
jgi:hypothetical protein